MAIIDIDRHIVTDMVGIQNTIDITVKRLEKSLGDIISLDNQITAYCNEKDCDKVKQVREQKYAIVNPYREDCMEMSKLLAQNNALLMHIVNRINEADTGKGKEFIRLNGSNPIQGKGKTGTSLDK